MNAANGKALRDNVINKFVWQNVVLLCLTVVKVSECDGSESLKSFQRFQYFSPSRLLGDVGRGVRYSNNGQCKIKINYENGISIIL